MTITYVVGGLWADALDPVVRKYFFQGMARRQPLVGRLFNVQTSQRAYEEVTSVGAISTEAWDSYEISGKVGQATFDQGYKKTYTHKEYPVELVIKRKWATDADPRVRREAMLLGDSAAVKIEVDAASVFNNAFDDNVAGADAVGLCSTAHPLSPQKTGTTQSNEGTLPLTRDNVATVRENMMAFTDDNTNEIAVVPNLLLVPPELEDEALVIAGTRQKPGSADNDLNPQAGRFGVQPWHYLTDSNAWFMIDTALMNMSLDWFNREPLSIGLKNTDRTIEATWISYMRYAFGWSDWRWIYGNNPS